MKYLDDSYKAFILNHHFYKYYANYVIKTFKVQTQEFMGKMLNDINDH